MGTTLPVSEQVWCRIVIGDDGLPHGVVMSRDATCLKSGSSRRPVPPMIAMRTGSGYCLFVSCHVGSRMQRTRTIIK